jgi:hypothetical protein
MESPGKYWGRAWIAKKEEVILEKIFHQNAQRILEL